MDPLRLAYLRALDIPVWLPRGQLPENAVMFERIRLGPGQGEVLLICDRQEEASSTLFSDIARALPVAPVWGWPDGSGSGLTVGDAVAEALFTGLVIFGHALADRLLGPNAPDRLGSARVLVTDDLGTLSSSASARRELWRRMCAEGLVKTR